MFGRVFLLVSIFFLALTPTTNAQDDLFSDAHIKDIDKAAKKFRNVASSAIDVAVREDVPELFELTHAIYQDMIAVREECSNILGADDDIIREERLNVMLEHALSAGESGREIEELWPSIEDQMGIFSKLTMLRFRNKGQKFKEVLMPE